MTDLMLSISGSRAAVRASGALSRFGSGSVAGYGDLYGIGLLRDGRFAFAVEGQGGAGAYNGGLAGHYANGGIKAGIGSHLAGRVAAGIARDTADYVVSTAEVTATSRINTVAASTTISLRRARSSFVTTAGASLSTAPGPLQLDAAFGVQAQTSASSMLWGQLSAAVLVAPHVAIVGSLARTAADIERGIPSAKMISMGVRLSSYRENKKIVAESGVRRRAATIVVQSSADSAQTLLIRFSGATRLEYRGNFTEWQPVALTSTGDGYWRAPVSLKSGLYLITIRADGGEWIVPPDLASSADDFGGANGLLIVE